MIALIVIIFVLALILSPSLRRFIKETPFLKMAFMLFCITYLFARVGGWIET